MEMQFSKLQINGTTDRIPHDDGFEQLHHTLVAKGISFCQLKLELMPLALISESLTFYQPITRLPVDRLTPLNKSLPLIPDSMFEILEEGLYLGLKGADKN
jgi:hypothetical protein